MFHPRVSVALFYFATDTRGLNTEKDQKINTLKRHKIIGIQISRNNSFDKI